ncbi:transporter family-2 protein [Nocardioides thalensis]|uniref:Transporter family-2 protein n=1 Tax=Nocardioides thalensis TaxID=1914755 RepID=A0A853C738_9ACTN|nr:transporter family-2 protein [Nocardioides thalensis]
MSSPPSRLLKIVAVPLMLGAGAVVAVQSEINGRLADEMGEGMRAGVGAAVISFGIGLVIVAAITLAVARHRVKDLVGAVRGHRLRPVELLGGLCGAFLVATQGLTIATIGVALFSVAMTAGQSASALLVDHLGLGPSGHQPLNVPRAIAATFAVAAVVLATGERLAEAFSWEVVVLALLPFLAGAGASVQQALNGRVARHAGAWVTTLNNFVVGTAALLLTWTGSFLVDGGLTDLPGTWWLYTGGALGVSFIWLAAHLVHVHGVLVLGLSMIAGQVVGAQLIELAGGDAHVGPVGIAAGGLIVVGVVVALFRRRQADA